MREADGKLGTLANFGVGEAPMRTYKNQRISTALNASSLLEAKAVIHGIFRGYSAPLGYGPSQTNTHDHNHHERAMHPAIPHS